MRAKYLARCGGAGGSWPFCESPRSKHVQREDTLTSSGQKLNARFHVVELTNFRFQIPKSVHVYFQESDIISYHDLLYDLIRIVQQGHHSDFFTQRRFNRFTTAVSLVVWISSTCMYTDEDINQDQPHSEGYQDQNVYYEERKANSSLFRRRSL